MKLKTHVLQVCDSKKVRRNAAGVPIEVDVTARVDHPNLVKTIEAASTVTEPVQARTHCFLGQPVSANADLISPEIALLDSTALFSPAIPSDA